MDQPLFTGACTALVTPFLGKQINYPMLQQLLLRQISAGIKAVVLAGTTGESATLSDTEKIELFHRGKEYVGSECLIIAGTGSNCTSHAVDLSMAAQEAGADALLVVSPYYNKATNEGLFAHFLSIAHAVDIPVILYNVPARTGVDIPVSVYKRLSAVPNIVGVKEATRDTSKITDILLACDPSFHVWSGNDDMTLPIMALGGKGVISVSSNLFPGQMAAMCEAALQADYETAVYIHRQLHPLYDLIFADVNPVPVKAAMDYVGFDCGGCRLPLTKPTKELEEKLAGFFA